MERLTDKLPGREKLYLHQDFLDNEESYWRIRERLLPHYRGKWVAVRAGEVVASGDTVFDVLDRVRTLGGHPYIALVGDEHRQLMIRRILPYDTSYAPERFRTVSHA